MSKDLVYLPLGGAGEIGMNMYLYGYGSDGDRRWIMVDCGVTFGDMENSPGVELIMADAAFIRDQADRLDGIFITHAHEDHVGAIGRLWPSLRAPVYARRFTAHIARLKMNECGLDTDTIQTVKTWPQTVDAGPFKVGFVPVSHSVPEASALMIETPAGRVFHTGDFKIDPTPRVGEPFDADLLSSVAKDGVDALACDSTNVFSNHPGRSESELVAPITALLQDAPGLVVATTFASNIARLQTLALAGQAAGRMISVYGRAMNRMLSAARETGLLTEFPDTVSESEAEDLPAENLMVLASGSQGERRAAMAQIASGNSRRVSLRDGDLVLFSSKTIPGNEKAVSRVFNQLSERGVRVVDETDGLYHVSGHANRPDLTQVHDLLKPKLLIPMHGEARHLAEHVVLAKQNGLSALQVRNGEVARIAGGAPEIVETVETGRVYLDGNRLIGALDGVVRERIKLANRGVVSIAVVVDQQGHLASDPVARILGAATTDLDGSPLIDIIEEGVDHAFATAKPRQRRDHEAIEMLVTSTVSQLCNRTIGRKPLVSVLIARVESV